ncbi:MAG: homocysteine S-methyltransferase family protein [Gemmatimonadales bacterium]
MHLPPCDGDPYITDGGIETTLIFDYGLDLPNFASFVLLDSPQGMAALRRYFQTYTDLAVSLGVGMVLESPTWRANPDWGRMLGYSLNALADIDHRAVSLMEEFRAQLDEHGLDSVISGDLGPRGDGYIPSARMTANEAADYHRPQIDAFAGTEADVISVLTMNYIEEATGIALAAHDARMPVVVSFTVETDGRLPTGDPLGRAIEEVDAATGGYPAYYMINCAHPTHVLADQAGSASWQKRVRGLRANASSMSHTELNESTALDQGDLSSFGALHASLNREFPHLSVVGGCCGTDHRHVELACRAVFS